MASSRGFTIVEMIVTTGILAVLLAIGYIRVSSLQRRVPLSATVEAVVADLKAQQTKSMIGDTQQSVSADRFGIKILPDQYVLFKGSAYNPADTTNMIFVLPANVTMNTTFPSGVVTYERGSGDVVGFVPGANTITVVQTLTGETKSITLNLYGAVTSVE